MKINILAYTGLILINSSFGKLKVDGVEVSNSNEHYLEYIRHMSVPFNDQNGAAWDAGNNVQGKTVAEIQAIVADIKLLETDARQKEIPMRMADAPTEWFTFSNLAHAKATVKQRLETIKMMGIFNGVNSRYWYGRPHRNPPIPYSTTAGHWDKGPRLDFLFRQKSGTAYQAITQLCDVNTVTKGECYGAIVACVWWGASQAMGQFGFDLIYPGQNALDMDFKSSGSGVFNTKLAVDKSDSNHVPGDWLYMVNHNYEVVIANKEFIKKGWINPSQKTYNWSGENALYFGSGKYEGLGVVNKTTALMREEMVTRYNEDLAEVIDNGGTINGDSVRNIILGDDANAKIFWKRIKRIEH